MEGFDTIQYASNGGNPLGAFLLAFTITWIIIGMLSNVTDQ